MASSNENSGEAPPIPDQLERCTIHMNDYKLICLDEWDKQGLIFKCDECAKEAPNKQYMNLSEFMDSTDRHVFEYLPSISSQLKQTLKQTLNNSSNIKIEEVEHLFNEIKSKVLEAIEDMRKQMVEKISNVSRPLENVYNQITRKDEIKKIIEDKSTFEEKSNNLKKEISEILRKSQENQDIIESILLQQQEDIKSLEPTQLLNQVQKGLQKTLIDFGHETSANQSLSQNFEQEIKKQEESNQEKPLKQIQKLMNLIKLQKINRNIVQNNEVLREIFKEIGTKKQITNALMIPESNQVGAQGAQDLSSSLEKLNNLISQHAKLCNNSIDVEGGSTDQQHQPTTHGAAEKKVHYPSGEFAVPIEYEPDYTNDETKEIHAKYSAFIYDCPEFEDQDAVELGYYKLETGQVYKGQWKNGMRHGRGKQLWKSGSIYEGYWKDNMANGKGRMIHSDGDVYEGEWKNDKQNGKGTYTHSDGAKYIGQWVDDQQEGEGVETWTDGAKYEGQYKKHKKHGRGKFSWIDGSEYIGEFSNNNIEGIGNYIWADGRNYNGGWMKNKMHGYGVFLFPDSRKYVGNYVDDKKEGYGEFEWSDGRKYKGNWRAGKQHGLGVQITAENEEITGYWDDGKIIRQNEEEDS